MNRIPSQNIAMLDDISQNVEPAGNIVTNSERRHNFSDRIDIGGDGSSYFGGKGGAGVYQTLINQIPPHDTYIETHLGAGAIMRHKRPAQINIGIDIDPAVIAMWDSSMRVSIIRDDATCWLRQFWRGRIRRDCFIYCDPPYLHQTRKSGHRYNFEMSRDDHAELIDVLKGLNCMVMISGYWSSLYAELLQEWRTISFEAQTRRGKATEWIWMNYPEPTELHDYRYLGRNFRERERIKRKRDRWVKRIVSMPILERKAIFMAVRSTIDKNKDARSISGTASRQMTMVAGGHR